MGRTTADRRLTLAGTLLGLGLGGFVDGIALHQLLQWHHLISSVDRYPTTTIAGLEANTLADGLFHTATYLLTLAGLWLLWTVLTGSSLAPGGRRLVGLLLFGWGIFNVVEGLINHHLLGLHHIREGAGNRLAWDLGFLGIGAVLIGGGWLMQRERATGSPLDRPTDTG